MASSTPGFAGSRKEKRPMKVKSFDGQFSGLKTVSSPIGYFL